MAKFEVGQSGNPEGRPKGSVSITSAIRRKLEEINPATRRQYVDDLVDVLIEKALQEKDFKVIKEIWNHMDGSPRQSSEEMGLKGRPIPIMGGLSISKEIAEKYSLSD